MAKSSGRARFLGWLGAFIALPLGVWFAASRASGFREKALSNLSLEPLFVAVLGCAVCLAWFLLARGGLKLLSGVILLIIVSAGALAVQLFAPVLRE